MSKLSAPKRPDCLSQLLNRPVLGSSSSIQPNVVASEGIKNEIQKQNSNTLEHKMFVRAISHERNIPSGSAINCSTMPILMLFQSERQMPGSLKASRHACSP